MGGVVEPRLRQMGSSARFFFLFISFTVTHSLLSSTRGAFPAYYKAFNATCRRSTTEQALHRDRELGNQNNHNNEKFQAGGVTNTTRIFNVNFTWHADQIFEQKAHPTRSGPITSTSYIRCI